MLAILFLGVPFSSFGCWAPIMRIFTRGTSNILKHAFVFAGFTEQLKQSAVYSAFPLGCLPFVDTAPHMMPIGDPAQLHF